MKSILYIDSKNKKHRMKPATIRQIILPNQDFKCYYCGTDITIENSTLEHIKPRSKNGGNNSENLACACKSCNTAKSNRSIDEFRFFKMVSSSRLKGVVTGIQAKKLHDLGVDLCIDNYTFHFEMMGW